AAQGRQGPRARGRAAHRLPRADPAGRPHHRARRDGDRVAARVAAARHVLDAGRRLRPARRGRDRDREDAQRARLAATLRLKGWGALVLTASALTACASPPETDPRYQPSASALEIIAVLERHVNDDTYRFEPARDFTDRNVYR